MTCSKRTLKRVPSTTALIWMSGGSRVILPTTMCSPVRYSSSHLSVAEAYASWSAWLCMLTNGTRSDEAGGMSYRNESAITEQHHAYLLFALPLRNDDCQLVEAAAAAGIGDQYCSGIGTTVTVQVASRTGDQFDSHQRCGIRRSRF